MALLVQKIWPPPPLPADADLRDAECEVRFDQASARFVARAKVRMRGGRIEEHRLKEIAHGNRTIVSRHPGLLQPPADP